MDAVGKSLRTGPPRGAAAGEKRFLDQLDDDSLAGRHDRVRQRCFGEAVAREEAPGVEAGIGEGVDEGLHDVGPDHVGAIAGDAPARQVETLGNLALAANAARADVVTEGGRVAERRPFVAADELEPGARPAERKGGGEGKSGTI